MKDREVKAVEIPRVPIEFLLHRLELRLNMRVCLFRPALPASSAVPQVGHGIDADRRRASFRGQPCDVVEVFLVRAVTV